MKKLFWIVSIIYVCTGVPNIFAMILYAIKHQTDKMPYWWWVSTIIESGIWFIVAAVYALISFRSLIKETNEANALNVMRKYGERKKKLDDDFEKQVQRIYKNKRPY